MHKNFRTVFILAAALAATTSAAFGSAVIDVNGVCQTATCTPTSLSPGGSDSGSFNFNVTIAATGDTFNFRGNYLDTLNAAGTIPVENLNLAVTLTSTKLPTGSGNDQLNITDLVDQFVFPYTSDTFFEQVTYSFAGPLAAGSNGSEQLIEGITPLPILGPFLSTGGTQSGSFNTAPTYLATSNPLDLSLEEDMVFDKDSMPGAEMCVNVVPCTAVPEPSYAAPVAFAGMGLVGLALLRRYRAVPSRA